MDNFPLFDIVFSEVISNNLRKKKKTFWGLQNSVSSKRCSAHFCAFWNVPLFPIIWRISDTFVTHFWRICDAAFLTHLWRISDAFWTHFWRILAVAAAFSENTFWTIPKNKPTKRFLGLRPLRTQREAKIADFLKSLELRCRQANSD